MSSTEADKVNKLYHIYGILYEAKDNGSISEHEAEYREIFTAVKGTDKEKRLVPQFIGEFSKFFPNMADSAVDAMLDLAKDGNIEIRRLTIMYMPLLCKDTKEHIPKIGGNLAQLLGVDDQRELHRVRMALQQILKYDAKAALAGIFTQIQTGEQITRDRCFEFLSVKLKHLGKEFFSEDVEAFIIGELKKIMQDVSADEFQICMNILASTKLGTTPDGQRELVALIFERAKINSEGEPGIIDDGQVDRYIFCANQALPYFSTQVESTPFIKYACEKLFPLHTWKLIGANDTDRDQQHLRVLKVFAEMTAFCGKLDTPCLEIEAILNVLQEYIPLPPTTEGNAAIEENPSFKFSHAECLLYALHKLGKQDIEYFAFKEDPNKLKEFRSRLQYLARGTQGHFKELKEAWIKGDREENDDLEKLKAFATNGNIRDLIRDLSCDTPIFDSVIQLSWVPKKSNMWNERNADEIETSSKRMKLSESEDPLQAVPPPVRRNIGVQTSEKEETQKRLAAAMLEALNEPDAVYESKCSVCKINDIDTYCSPCGHLCCRKCWDSWLPKFREIMENKLDNQQLLEEALKTPACMFCRVPVSSLSRAYYN